MTMASTNLSPTDQDLSAIKSGDWPQREFPLGPRERPTRRQVIFRQSVLNNIHTHGREAPDIEVCGVLVGNVYADAMGPFVFIESSIRGDFSTGKAAQVTFTARTWSHIQEVMDREHPDLRILGWYHTHPGHGIFLSDMDLFIHKNFFSLPWHLAFVFDPQHWEEGLFAWRTGNMAVESFVVQKDAQAEHPPVARRLPEVASPPASTHPATDTAAVQGQPATAATRPTGSLAEVADLAARVQSLERRQRWMSAALAMAVLVAIAWPLALAAWSMLRTTEKKFDPNLPPMQTNIDQSDPDTPPPVSSAARPASKPPERSSAASVER